MPAPTACCCPQLVHALQDRDQDLPTWYDAHTDTYDAALAAMSVVEGEARLEEKRFAVSVLGLDPSTVDSRQAFRQLGPPCRDVGADATLTLPRVAFRVSLRVRRATAVASPDAEGAHRRLWIFSRRLPPTRARCSTPATPPPPRRGLRRSRPRRRRSGRSPRRTRWARGRSTWSALRMATRPPPTSWRAAGLAWQSILGLRRHRDIGGGDRDGLEDRFC